MSPATDTTANAPQTQDGDIVIALGNGKYGIGNQEAAAALPRSPKMSKKDAFAQGIDVDSLERVRVLTNA